MSIFGFLRAILSTLVFSFAFSSHALRCESLFPQNPFFKVIENGYQEEQFAISSKVLEKNHRPYMVLTLFYKSAAVGRLSVEILDEGMPSAKSHISLQGPLHDLGLGQILYLAGALKVEHEFGLTLKSSEYPSQDATHAWEGLVRKGFAQRMDSRRFQFELDSIVLPVRQKIVSHFVDNKDGNLPLN